MCVEMSTGSSVECSTSREGASIIYKNSELDYICIMFTSSFMACTKLSKHNKTENEIELQITNKSNKKYNSSLLHVVFLLL